MNRARHSHVSSTSGHGFQTFAKAIQEHEHSNYNLPELDPEYQTRVTPGSPSSLSLSSFDSSTSHSSGEGSDNESTSTLATSSFGEDGHVWRSQCDNAGRNSTNRACSNTRPNLWPSVVTLPSHGQNPYPTPSPSVCESDPLLRCNVVHSRTTALAGMVSETASCSSRVRQSHVSRRRDFSQDAQTQPPQLQRDTEHTDAMVRLIVVFCTHLIQYVSSAEQQAKSMMALEPFIKETLRRSKTSYSTLQIALYYIVLLHEKRQMHRESSQPSANSSQCKLFSCGRRMFLAALILASKYLQDRNYSARAWSKISGLSLQEINENERQILRFMNWDLHVPKLHFENWCRIVLSVGRASMIEQLNPIRGNLQSSMSWGVSHRDNGVLLCSQSRWWQSNLSSIATHIVTDTARTDCFIGKLSSFKTFWALQSRNVFIGTAVESRNMMTRKFLAYDSSDKLAIQADRNTSSTTAVGAAQFGRQSADASGTSPVSLVSQHRRTLLSAVLNASPHVDASVCVQSAQGSPWLKVDSDEGYMTDSASQTSEASTVASLVDSGYGSEEDCDKMLFETANQKSCNQPEQQHLATICTTVEEDFVKISYPTKRKRSICSQQPEPRLHPARFIDPHYLPSSGSSNKYRTLSKPDFAIGVEKASLSADVVAAQCLRALSRQQQI